MRTHLNILQDEQIWTLHRNDYSERDVTIVIGVDGVLLCEWLDPVPTRWEMLGAESSMDILPTNISGESSDVPQLSAGIPESVQKLVKTLGGRPHVRSLHWEYPVDLGSLTRADEDLSDLKKLYTISKHPKRQHRAPGTQCPDCNFVAVRGVDLYKHIKDNHLASKSYACWDCDKNFQTDHDCTNHMNAIHRAKAFSCIQCSFTAAMEHRMLDHVHAFFFQKASFTHCHHHVSKMRENKCDIPMWIKVNVLVWIPLSILVLFRPVSLLRGMEWRQEFSLGRKICVKQARKFENNGKSDATISS